MGNTTIQTQSFRAVDAEQSKSKRYIIPFALLCSLFFLWAVANNLNDILLPQFQQAFTLTNFQAGLIQSAFYFGYFVIPIPAGILMKKLSYKAGIITGLFLYAVGAALFWPAAEIMNYTLFLIGLFIIAAGLGCLETAANPFVTVLGPESG
ncbi:L-fucose-proton symporter [Salmonella enterica]|nr:L-fucose transporter [Salmonella enterica]